MLVERRKPDTRPKGSYEDKWQRSKRNGRLPGRTGKKKR